NVSQAGGALGRLLGLSAKNGWRTGDGGNLPIGNTSVQGFALFENPHSGCPARRQILFIFNSVVETSFASMDVFRFGRCGGCYFGSRVFLDAGHPGARSGSDGE